VHVVFATLQSREVSAMGPLYLAGALRRAGHTVSLVQAEDEAAVLAAIAREKPRVVGLSATTGLHRVYLAWARAIRAAYPEVAIVLGGPHATFFPETLEAEPALDALCVGEGEESLLDWVAALEAGGPRACIPGFRVRAPGRILDGGLRAPPRELDSLAPPARDLYYAGNPYLARFPVKAFLASRGCPYRCTYCFNRSLNDMYRGMGKPVRWRAPAALCDEIEEVRARWPLGLVWILDANFAVSRAWMRSFVPVYRARIGLPFFCKVRPNLVDPELADLLAEGGCTGVGMGVESGDDALRNDVLGRGLSREQIVTSCRLLKERGIRIMTFNMLGLPGETYERARATVDLNIECRVDYAAATILQPYPKTEIARRAAAEGWFDGDYDRIGYDYYSSTPLASPSEDDRKRILNLQRLFGLAVEFPEVRRSLDWLTARKGGRLYTEAFKLFHLRCFHKRFYEARGRATC